MRKIKLATNQSQVLLHGLGIFYRNAVASVENAAAGDISSKPVTYRLGSEVQSLSSLHESGRCR